MPQKRGEGENEDPTGTKQEVKSDGVGAAEEPTARWWGGGGVAKKL